MKFCRKSSLTRLPHQKHEEYAREHAPGLSYKQSSSLGQVPATSVNTEQRVCELPEMPVLELDNNSNNDCWELPGQQPLETFQQQPVFFEEQCRDEPGQNYYHSQKPSRPTIQPVSRRTPVVSKVQTAIDFTNVHRVPHVEDQVASRDNYMDDLTTITETNVPIGSSSTSTSSTVSPVTPAQYEANNSVHNYYQPSDFKHVSPYHRWSIDEHYQNDRKDSLAMPFSSVQVPTPNHSDPRALGFASLIMPISDLHAGPISSDFQQLGLGNFSQIGAESSMITDAYNPAYGDAAVPCTYVVDRLPAPNPHYYRNIRVLPCGESCIDDPVPPYSADNGMPSSTPISYDLRPKRAKRSFPKNACSGLIELACGQCEKVFKGHFRKGNRNRHIENFHTTDMSRRRNNSHCRFCPKMYRR